MKNHLFNKFEDNQATLDSPSSPHTTVKLRFFPAFFFLVMTLSLVFLWYQNYQLKHQANISQDTQKSQKQIEIPQPSLLDISHSTDNGVLLIKYGNSIFEADKENPQTLPVHEYANTEKLTWIKHSIQFVSNDLTKTSIFDAKALPNDQGVIMVVNSYANISATPLTGLEGRAVYHLLSSGTPISQSYPLLNFFSNDYYKGRTFPKIAEVSKDGKIVAFDMYGCWECGGHNPEKMVVKLDSDEDYSRKSLNLGVVQDFTFNDTNSFSYRQYPIECQENDWQQNIEKFTTCVTKNKKPLVTKSL